MSYEYDKLKGQLDELATTIQEKTDTKELLTIPEMNQCVKDIPSVKDVLVGNTIISNKVIESIDVFKKYMLYGKKGEGTHLKIKDSQLIRNYELANFDYNKYKGIIEVKAKFNATSNPYWREFMNGDTNCYKLIINYPLYANNYKMSYIEMTWETLQSGSNSVYNCSYLREIKINPNREYSAAFDCRECESLILIEYGDKLCDSFGLIERCPSLMFCATKYTKSILSCPSFSECNRMLGTKTTDSMLNPDGEQLGHVYVPDELLETYKADSEWSQYINALKPLSEYENDVINTKILYVINDEKVSNIISASFDNVNYYPIVLAGIWTSTIILKPTHKLYIKRVRDNAGDANVTIQYKDRVIAPNYNEVYEINFENNTENEYIWVGQKEFVEEHANKTF